MILDNTPLLFDTFCGGGGASVGYDWAGFKVVGCDNRPQKHYPFDFLQADALDLLRRLIDGEAITFASGRAYRLGDFVAIHASPPCQGYSEATPMQCRDDTPKLIPDVRALLLETGKPFVIENVENARSELGNSVMLCGTMFELPLWRHRYFETWPMWLMSPATCKHNRHPITVHSGSHSRQTWEPVRCTGGARTGVRPRESVEVVRVAMQIDWMTQGELTEAIPPAYTRWIGEQLMSYLETQP